MEVTVVVHYRYKLHGLAFVRVVLPSDTLLDDDPEKSLHHQAPRKHIPHDKEALGMAWYRKSTIVEHISWYEKEGLPATAGPKRVVVKPSCVDSFVEEVENILIDTLDAHVLRLRPSMPLEGKIHARLPLPGNSLGGQCQESKDPLVRTDGCDEPLVPHHLALQISSVVHKKVDCRYLDLSYMGIQFQP